MHPQGRKADLQSHGRLAIGAVVWVVVLAF
jgi:hypothetical protein